MEGPEIDTVNTDQTKTQLGARISSSWHVEVAGLTDVGRVRSSNQDSFYIDREENLYIVADGMGGHAGGEIASKLCVQQVHKHIQSSSHIFEKAKQHPDGQILRELAEAINFASTKIYERALEDPSLKGMGTTATVVKLVNKYLYVAHVGDSRCYLVRCKLIYQITNDHSLVSEQVRAGILTQEEADLHHLRNVITRSVGYQEEEDVDTTSLPLEHGDTIVICSDGLHGKVSDREISLKVTSDGPDAAKNLVALANERGGDDNISVIVIRITNSNIEI